MAEAKRTILVVDDTKRHLQMVSDALRDKGHNVVISTDGEQALKMYGMLVSQKHHVIAIVTDQQMRGDFGPPGGFLDGHEWIGELYRRHVENLPPVVVYSAACGTAFQGFMPLLDIAKPVDYLKEIVSKDPQEIESYAELKAPGFTEIFNSPDNRLRIAFVSKQDEDPMKAIIAKLEALGISSPETTLGK